VKSFRIELKLSIYQAIFGLNLIVPPIETSDRLLCFGVHYKSKLPLWANELGHIASTEHIRVYIDHTTMEYGLTREEAYCLCGVVLDLKISQIVDTPNWMVSAYLPLSIFV